MKDAIKLLFLIAVPVATTGCGESITEQLAAEYQDIADTPNATFEQIADPLSRLTAEDPGFVMPSGNTAEVELLWTRFAMRLMQNGNYDKELLDRIKALDPDSVAPGGGELILTIDEALERYEKIEAGGGNFADYRDRLVESAVESGDTEDLLDALEESGAAVKRDIGGQVTQISLPGISQITDAGLEHFKALNSLEFLNLSNTPITDAGLEHLKGLTNLETLLLDHAKVTDAGLEHLRGLTNLRWLGLRNIRITDAGIEHLEELTNLETLPLDGAEVTDAGLEHLRGLTNLKSLRLNGTEITDAGLEHLKGLSNLVSLRLYAPKVTDAGLDHLKGLTNLVELTFIDTEVTSDGVAELQESLPNCRVSR